jgi:NAD-dependent deacetylase
MGIVDEEAFKEALILLKEARSVVCLTGAGVSVPSGIPPFRGHGGLWERYDPREYAHIQAFRRDTKKLWTLMHHLYLTIQTAKPNPAHFALARLEKIGRIGRIITQNIAGLHQKAGSQNVIEYHGSMERLACLSCKLNYSVGENFPLMGEVPLCPECSNPLKPDIVLFGEPIPREAIKATQDLLSVSDTLLVVGSSCTVATAA